MGLGHTLYTSDIVFLYSNLGNKSNYLTDIFSDWYVYISLSDDIDLMLSTPLPSAFTSKENAEDNPTYIQA